MCAPVQFLFDAHILYPFDLLIKTFKLYNKTYNKKMRISPSSFNLKIGNILSATPSLL